MTQCLFPIVCYAYKKNDRDKIVFYKKYCNKLTRLKEIAKRNYYNNLFKTCSHDSSKTWSTINNLVSYRNHKSYDNFPTEFSIDGKKYDTHTTQFANILNDHFTDIGHNMSKAIPVSKSNFSDFMKNTCSSSFFMRKIEEDEILTAINNLKATSTSDSQGMSTKFIKLSKVIISHYLCVLFNKCVDEDNFPICLKQSQIIPLPKVSQPKHLSDIRPISLLPALSKVFEKIIYARLIKFIDKHNILNNAQHGFRTNDSTDLAIATIYDKLLDNMNENKFTCATFLDLSKAFDTVDHDILMKKIHKYGLRGKIWNILHSYLSKRKQCTKISSSISNFRDISCGVPQGSILGPLLFLLYVNDFPHSTNCHTTQFADDTNLHLSNANLTMLQQNMEIELAKIDNWMRCNKLTLNYTKTCYMIVGKKVNSHSSFTLAIGNNTITQTDNVKYLGVILDKNLNWKLHISNLCSKLSKICGVFYKIRHFVPLSTLRIVYFSLVQSHLQYSLLNWSRANKTVFHSVEVLQNKILRACLFHDRFTSTSVLYNQFHVLKLNDLTKLEYGKFMLKYKMNLLPSYFDGYFKKIEDIHSYNTRYKSNQNYFIPTVKSNHAKKSLQFLGAKIWQNIPSEIKTVNLACFKREFKKLLLLNYHS